MRSFLPAVLAILPAARGFPQDTVVYLSGKSDTTASVQGEIVEYLGQQLTIRTAAGEKILAGKPILEIRTAWSEQRQAAKRLQQQGEMQAAAERFIEAIKAESRGWAKRMLLAELVRCYDGADQIEEAGEYFLQLLASDPQTPDYDAIPLCWNTRSVKAEIQRRAAAWIDDKRPAAQLLGASWLLTSQRVKALNTFKTLSTNSDSRIAQLASAQQWRTQTVTVKASSLGRWEALIERIPQRSGLRSGPLYLLGEALARLEQTEPAALAFLKTPLLYPRQHRLSAECLLRAGKELEKIERRNEALSLYREITQKYPHTRPASAAAEYLK